jgi:hypothetical protein
VNPALGKDAPALTQAIVKIRLHDGQVLVANANGAPGYPDRPASAVEMDGKFLSCGLRALSQDSLRAALACLHRLDAVSDIRELAELICPQC